MIRSKTSRPSSLTRFSRSLALLVATLGLLTGQATPVEAAKVPRSVLKEYFQTGDKPSQAQFGAIIDSVLNLSEDRDLLGLRTYSDGTAAVLEEGSFIDGSLAFGPAEGLSNLWAGQSGFLGLSFLEDSQVHYGYLQISAGAPGSSDVYPMFVSYFVFEDVAGEGLSVTSVPEPSSWALAAVGLLSIGALARRSRGRGRARRQSQAG